ncbi:hypothetical protein [Lentibacillus persicus]|uniref:hypothetical protein n=1 Tax=Lentibacillus persicus TaxID=640948 RepID=UPI000B7F0C4E|nr:hypothetical protein [Lentibacillus persicus]
MKKLIKRFKFLFTFHKSIPFIADFFYFFGFVDDITVAAFLLQQMVKAAPASLKEKHDFR